MSTYIFDTMIVKVLFLLNCESLKYIAKLFSLSIYMPTKYHKSRGGSRVSGKGVRMYKGECVCVCGGGAALLILSNFS